MLKAGASAGALVVASRALAQAQDAPSPPATAPAGAFCYVDGYHGGVDGHMPPNSLRNVLDGLDRSPRWKVSFEIEPYSWAVFAKTDLPSIEQLKRFLADATAAGRVEIVSGAYGQAYMWNASGESNIRQIEYGLAELRAAFPGVVVDTYAVQEPCWTSCLPQLLKSFGYRRAVLKNSTCWGGYHAPTLDADLIHWVSPDGTALTAVPRYASEPLVPPATMAGAQPTAAFIDQCAADGIEHPSGTILQDMGWPGRPWRLGISQAVADAMRHVTWREYVDTIASPPQKRWKASQEDLRVGLPWGGSVLQRVAQLVRASENRIVQAEKLSAMAFVRRGRPFPTAEVRQAWKDLLWSQHHDVWIVSQNRHGTGTWATTVETKTEAIAQACARIVDDSTAAMAPEAGAAVKAGTPVRVFNTTGFRRRDVASLEVEPGNSFRVTDAQGLEVPCQLVPAENKARSRPTLMFAAEAPALGYASYRIAPTGAESASAKKNDSVIATKRPDGTVVLETDLLSVSIDPARGGRIRSLVAKDLQREFVDDSGPRSFNEYRGYFPNEGKWLSSIEQPADISITEQGALRVAAIIRGHIGAWPFETRLSLTTGTRRLDFQTTFKFPLDPPPAPRVRRAPPGTQPQLQAQPPRFRLGEPWEPSHDTVRSNRRPFYDSSYKLQALFPAKLRRPTLDKSAPFDVCRASNTDTRFDAWESIKNNVIFNWVDLLDEDGSAGLALLTDHVTAYHMAPGEPLGLVMCYAGRGIWHDYALTRVPRVAYSLVPHAGDWAKAKLWQELARWSEPLVAIGGNAPAGDDASWSLLDASDNGFEATTASADGDDVVIRLFNAGGDAAPKTLTIDGRIRRIKRIELDGRIVNDLPVERIAGGISRVTIAMPRFAIRTLRCELA